MTIQETIKQLNILLSRERYLLGCSSDEQRRSQTIEALEVAKEAVEKIDFAHNLDKNKNNLNNNLSDEELAFINSYTRRELTKDEVYVFSIVLCDNDIDRDGERFTVESLFALEKLFVGKTGIIDHNPSAKNQTARIFACTVEAVEGKKTQTGDDYFRLKARAYIIKDKHNGDIVRLIDNGTLNEVSIGCGVSKIRCNVCGAKKGECSHEIGRQYGYRVCYHDIINIYDVYEWSLKSTAKTNVESTDVKHGEWVLLDECANEGVYCSVCHKKVYKTDYANQKFKSNYCPNCGAKMDKE